ncbi:MAG: class I tRNA ligase family protein, partial [Chloroflexota bacterium]|nr:class I tRNA ligase family protein [Chloroflexota bacterium]
PDDYVRRFSADVVRLYLMFIGPWEQGGDWSDSGINGVARWVSRLWEVCQRDVSALPAQGAADGALTRKTHQTIRRVLADVERFKMNTAISALMELSNELSRVHDEGAASREAWSEGVERLLLLLAPLAPHLAEELWERTGRAYSVHQQPLPEWDAALAAEEEATLVVQVNGRLRDRISVPAGVSDADAKQAALDSERVRSYVEGREVARVLYVPERYLVNIVVR